MLRTSTTPRSLLAGFTKFQTQNARLSYGAAASRFRPTASLQQINNRRPRAVRSIARPAAVSLLYATQSKSTADKLINEKLGSDPETSPEKTQEISEAKQDQKENHESDGEMLAGVKADLVTIKETFSMADVPRDSLYLGMAGLIPYALTSASTVVLSYDINHAHATGNGYLFSPETAHQLLGLISPIQIGFGAVIISFLGAIHWGLEYAGYGGYHGYRRLMIGVAAPAVAWPTIFMPVEYALIVQFLAFNGLYFADARATVKGWCPQWYSTYRFVLTFIVGASIVASLVGHGQIAREDQRLKSSVEYIKDDRDAQWVALEKEEKERRASLAKEEEDEEDDEEEEGNDEEEEGSEKKKDDKKEDGKKEDGKKSDEKENTDNDDDKDDGGDKKKQK